MSVKVQCVRCKKEFPIHEISETPLNAPLCEDCAKAWFPACSCCGSFMTDDDTICLTNGSIICKKCFNDFSFHCPDCGGNYYYVDGWHGVGVDNEDYVCDSCFKNYERCELCGEWWTDTVQGQNEGGYSMVICGDCREYNPNVYRCPECGDYFWDELGTLHGTCWHCTSAKEKDKE